jgi:protein SERAC1
MYRSDRNVQTPEDDQTCGSTKDDENSLKSCRTDASLRPSTNSSSTESSYGLFILHDQPNDRNNAVDIIAVHGLNGHYEKTWQETGPDGPPVNWLRDFLPSQIPYARIMSYGYNSTILFSKSEADFGTFAEQLLEDVLSRRTRGMERPMIFICHSLGGIVFKKVGPPEISG